MSLLIKALNKAEQAQAENAKTEQTKALQLQAEKKTAKPMPEPVLELDLAPASKPVVADVVIKPTPSYTPPSVQPSANNAQAKNAANVFSAKGNEAKTDSARLAMIAVAGLTALLGMGLYFYQFVDNSQPIVVPARPLDQAAASPQVVATASTETPAEQNLPQQNIDTQTNSTVPAEESVSSETPPLAKETILPPADIAEVGLAAIKKPKKTKAMVDDEAVSDLEEELESTNLADEPAEETILADNEDATNRLQASFSSNKTTKKTRKSKNNAAIASDSASIQVSKSTPQAGVSPALMAAYEAYNAGNDKDAIKLYKQVLQLDVRNVDALLGLGAIAARQGRAADANGWYSKVLEVDPRNNIAKTAMLDSQSQGNESTNETSLKNMLAKQPNDANLHVALGNLYAEQNQWPAAQQAYFDAYSLNKTADNAYNLAVSLDQMGKPKLALPYYLRALEQTTDASNIDKAALQARITAIQ
jgi:tetratricopeptide (TPR) repeat protein